MKLSIIICTYNRSHYLKKCLDSLQKQIINDLEILIIDNNSSDSTKEIVSRFNNKIINLRYIFEPSQGLSIARNRGINEAHADWILYLDDDAIAFPNLVERVLYLAERGDFDCVGGMYYGYFEGEKPKWINESFGTNEMFSNELTKCPYYVPHGCIVLYRKNKLLEVGTFNLKYGMTENKIQYGEEIDLQKRIEENGGKIAFDPELNIFHLNKRLSVRSFLVIKYELGKSHKIRNKSTVLFRCYKLLKSSIGIFMRLPINTYKLSFSKGYYWQNLIIDTFGPMLYFIGNI